MTKRQATRIVTSYPARLRTPLKWESAQTPGTWCVTFFYPTEICSEYLDARLRLTHERQRLEGMGL